MNFNLLILICCSALLLSCSNSQIQKENNREIASEQLELFPSKPKSYDRTRELRLDNTTASGEPGSMMNIPVRDQGRYGTCFAEAAAQMVDAFRFTVNNDTRYSIRTSPIAMAISGQALYAPERQLNGGHIFEMLNFARIHGIQSEMSMIKCAVSKTDKKEVNAFMRLFSSYTNTLNNKAKEVKALGFESLESSDSYNNFKKQLNAKYSNQILEYLGKTGRNSNSIPPINVISQLLDNDPYFLYWGIMNYSCINEVPKIKVTNLPNFSMRNVFQMSYNEYMKYIKDRLVNERSLPVAVYYCAGILSDGYNYQGASKKIDSVCLPRLDGREGGAHASLIIGVRKNEKNDGFDFLIRNSWGKDCKYKNPKLTLPLEIRQKYQDEWFPQKDVYYTGWDKYSTDWECDNGNIWVDSKTMYKSTYAVLSFKK